MGGLILSMQLRTRAKPAVREPTFFKASFNVIINVSEGRNEKK